MSDNPARLEPGLLPIFKALTSLQFVIVLLAFCNLSNNSDPGDVVMIVFMLLHSTLLLLYLRVTRLQRWFRRLYLPLALVAASALPILFRALAVVARLEQGMIGDASLPDGGTLLLWLFAPLVVVAAQYGWWMVVLFSILTTTLELSLALGLVDAGSVPFNVFLEQEIIRNLIFLAIGWVIARLIGEQRRQRQELSQANQQLKQFAVTLEQLAVSRERNRMARDLHDTLAHTLSAVAIQLEAVQAVWDTAPDVAKQRIDTIQHVTRDGLTETRRALHALRSSPIDDMGLLLSLRHISEKAAERAGFRLHINLPDDLPDLPDDRQVTAYRIAEEALNNAVRHAQASDLWLTLTHSDAQLQVRIRDNGSGFDDTQDPPQGHYGIIGMHERAALIGGTVQIESEIGIGTRIVLTIPITPEQHH